MPLALEEAGAVQRCSLHPEQFRPCQECDRAFAKANGQRTAQRRREQKVAHEKWLREHGAASAQHARRQMDERGR